MLLALLCSATHQWQQPTHLSQDALLDELLHERLSGRVSAEPEQGGHALVLLLRQVILIEELVG